MWLLIYIYWSEGFLHQWILAERNDRLTSPQPNKFFLERLQWALSRKLQYLNSKRRWKTRRRKLREIYERNERGVLFMSFIVSKRVVLSISYTLSQMYFCGLEFITSEILLYLTENFARVVVIRLNLVCSHGKFTVVDGPQTWLVIGSYFS